MGWAHMREVKDLTGQVFGKLTVISKDLNRTTKKVKWLCKCSCNRVISVSSTHLVQEHTKACRYCKTPSNFIDLSGQQFHHLTCIKYSKEDCKWQCRCLCGNEMLATAINLKSGNTKSCGCQSGTLMRSAAIKKYENLIVNGLEFIEPTEMTDITGHIVWKIKCVCGKLFDRPASVIVSGHTKSCGCISNNLRSKSLGGTGNPYENASVYETIRASAAYVKWRTDAFIRANHICQGTGIKTSKLQVHHIVPLNVLVSQYNINKDNIEEYSNILFADDNAIVLSEDVHFEFHTKYGHDASEDDLNTFLLSFNSGN